MSSLDDLRTQIDALDAALLRLIDDRAALGKAIGEAKTKAEPTKAQICLLRPDREAILIRKLIKMPRKAASDALIARIWHELISENLRIQGAATGGLNLTLNSADPAKDVLVWARDRFGFAPSHSYVKDAASAIQAARDVRHISVLSLDPRGGAWWARLLAEPNVRIIAALPETSGARPLGLALAAMTPEPTGDDMTFWVSDSPASETQLVDELAQRGFAADWLCTAQGVKLFGLIGYVQEHDPRLSEAKLGSLTGIVGAAARI